MSPKRPPVPISMEKQGGGEIAAKRARRTSAAGAGEDRLSALPDDILVFILLRLRTPEAARTSGLARRWRRVWGLLPELRFASFPEPHGFHDALDAWAVPLRYLLVRGVGAAPAESLATWLPAAARRLSGKFVLVDEDPGTPAEGGSDVVEATERGALDLPCFEEATSISLDLGFLGLAVPPAGVFARLTELSLIGVRFDGPCDLGDAVSLPRCPCLQKLTVQNARGLENIIIHSGSLRLVLLKMVRGLRQLTITAALLEELWVLCCFFHGRAPHAFVNISVPQLKVLKWVDVYDPRSVHLGKMEHLQSLSTFYLVYGPESFALNRAYLMLMSRFKGVEYLSLALTYSLGINNQQYLMEDMTMLPDILSLHLILSAKGHSFGACSFHVLRLCAGIKRLIMDLSGNLFLKAQDECPQDCICCQPSNWKTDELMLNGLHEVEIQAFRGSEHELVFVKRLLTWATALKRMTVSFNRSVSESMSMELCQVFRNFCKPEIRMEFCVSEDG